MTVAVFHAFIMVVNSNGENFFGTVLIDNVLVEIFFDNVRFIFGENIVKVLDEFAVDGLFLAFIVFGYKIIDIFI